MGCQKDAHAQFLAYIFIENSNNAKYGSLKTVLLMSFALGHNDYPKDLTQAMKVLEQHKHDNAGKKKKTDFNKNKNNENNTVQALSWLVLNPLDNHCVQVQMTPIRLSSNCCTWRCCCSR